VELVFGVMSCLAGAKLIVSLAGVAPKETEFCLGNDKA